MTILEYNKKFYPKYSGAECMLAGIERTLSKCKDPEDVKYQFSCSGWNEESIAFLMEAVTFYNDAVKKKAIRETKGPDLIYATGAGEDGKEPKCESAGESDI